MNAVASASAAQALDDAPRETWPKPEMRLLGDDCAPAPTLDDDALPADWEKWISCEAAALACPRDYVAAGLIGAASAWIGNARRIAVTADWIEPAHMWFALIGAPSVGKTPAIKPMTEASWKLERDAEPAWRVALEKCQCDVEAAKSANGISRNELRNDATSNKAEDERIAAHDRPADAKVPDKPPRPRVVTMDASTEELQRLLADNPRGLLHVRDELAGWLGGFDRYGGRGADRSFYLECWNGGAYVCDRVKFRDVPVRIEHASLAIIGGMVPDRLREVLADADDGLAERFLFVWPEPVAIGPLPECGAADAAERRTRLNTAARNLRGLTMGADDHGRPAPIALRPDTDAAHLFDAIRREAMTTSRSAHGLAAGWHGKNPGRALRIALVFELLGWAARSHGAPCRQPFRPTR